MKKSKEYKLLLLIVTLFAFTGSAIANDEESSGAAKPKPVLVVAEDLEVKLHAFTNFEAAYMRQNHLKGTEKNLSVNNRDFVFASSAAFFLGIEKKADEFSYGGKIVLVPTVKKKGSPSYNGTHIFVQSDFGKVEAGSPTDAASNMYLDGSSIEAAGGWDSYAKTDSGYLSQGLPSGPSFATYSQYYLDDRLSSPIKDRVYSNEPSRRISYYTPDFEFGNSTKLQLGVSYAPDTSNTGADKQSSNSAGVDNIQVSNTEYFSFDKSIKNALSGGVTISHNISDGIDFKMAITGEYGKAANVIKYVKTGRKPDPDNDTQITSYKLQGLRTYNIGALLSIGNFQYAASYGSLNKSFTTKEFHKTGRDTFYYTGAIAYKQGPFNTSLGYFKSNQFKNTVDSFTLSASYKAAPGLKPYVAVTEFILNGKPEFAPSLKKKRTRGTIALIGAKLNF